MEFLTTILSLTVVLFLSIAIWIVKRRNPSLRLGDAINHIIIIDHVSIFVGVMIFANLAEALWAASIHPNNQVHINIVTRFVGHLVIGALSVTSGIMVSAYARRIINNELKLSFWYICLILSSIIMAFTLPFLNLLVIAGGIGQPELVYYMFYYPMESFSRMEYGLQASTILTLVHIAAMIMDIMYILATGTGVSDKKNENKTEMKQTTPDSEVQQPKKNSIGIEDMLREILKFVGEYSEDRVARSAKQIRNHNDSFSQAKLVSKLNDLYRRAKMARESSMSESFSDELKQDIYKFFSSSPTNGEGLGSPLSVRGL